MDTILSKPTCPMPAQTAPHVKQLGNNTFAWQFNRYAIPTQWIQQLCQHIQHHQGIIQELSYQDFYPLPSYCYLRWTAKHLSEHQLNQLNQWIQETLPEQA